MSDTPEQERDEVEPELEAAIGEGDGASAESEVDAEIDEGDDAPAEASLVRRVARAGLGGTSHGFYFYGVVRTRGRRGREPDDVLRVRYRDLEALVRPGPYKVPTLDATHVQAHHRIVEGAMRRGTVLPAPYGVVFRGRRALVRFLEDQYLALDEGLAFLEGHWELRIHAEPAQAEEPLPELIDAADHVYAELRRSARAAIPFAREDRRLLSAAFLVARATWIDFVNRAEDLVAAQPALTFDVTGPWPPYDFVKMSV